MFIMADTSLSLSVLVHAIYRRGLYKYMHEFFAYYLIVPMPNNVRPQKNPNYEINPDHPGLMTWHPLIFLTCTAGLLWYCCRLGGWQMWQQRVCSKPLAVSNLNLKVLCWISKLEAQIWKIVLLIWIFCPDWQATSSMLNPGYPSPSLYCTSFTQKDR